MLASLSVPVLMSSLGTSIASAGLPAMAEALGASFKGVQWIVLAYLLATTSLVVSAGRFGDIVGRRRLLVAGIVLFTAASAACGVAPSLAGLIAARTVQGVAAAILMAITVAMVGESVPRTRTGTAMGVLGAMSAVGTTLGPSLGGMLISALGWRAIFLINVPIGIVSLGLVLRHLPTDVIGVRGKWSQLDAAGTTVLAVALGMYALAVTGGGAAHGRFDTGLLLAAAGVLAAFVVVEVRAKAPLLNLTMLRNPVLATGLVTSLMVSTVMMATLVVGPFYLSRALGLSPAAVGLVMSAGPLVAALAGIPAGRLVDRIGTTWASVAGLCGMAAGSVLLWLMPVHAGISGYLAAIALLTGHYALFQAANNTGVMGSSTHEQRGVTSGVLNLARNLGLVTGASVMGAVFSMGTGSVDILQCGSDEVAKGMRFTFGVGAAVIAAALFASVAGKLSRTGLRRLRTTGTPTTSPRLDARPRTSSSSSSGTLRAMRST